MNLDELIPAIIDHNFWQWGFVLAILLGVVFLVLLSNVRMRAGRWLLVVVTVIGMTTAAFTASWFDMRQEVRERQELAEEIMSNSGSSFFGVPKSTLPSNPLDELIGAEGAKGAVLGPGVVMAPFLNGLFALLVFLFSVMFIGWYNRIPKANE